MTWREFKEAVEQQGVLDTDDLWSIDFYTDEEEPQTVLVYKDEDGIVISDHGYDV